MTAELAKEINENMHHSDDTLPISPAFDENNDLATYLEREVNDTLNSYRAKHSLILEQAAAEESIQSGGYGNRQLYELIQNGADEILRGGGTGKIEVMLTPSCLYCANEGAPVTIDGIQSLLQMHLSTKHGNEIGRFGLGFKAVLGICDHPEFISRAVSFRFNPTEQMVQMRELVGGNCPLPRMRTAALLNYDEEISKDLYLATLLSWATTVIRLPLTTEASIRLFADVKRFPREFLLFSPHVTKLTLTAKPEICRTITVSTADGKVCITEDEEWSTWRVFVARVSAHDLPDAAKQDMDVRLREKPSFPIAWAVPTDILRRQRGLFWAFFPTDNETTLQGILNAPWKTNSDRQNLLNGLFNREMLRHAAELASHSISALNSVDDPARFLDFLPARDEADWADKELRTHLIATLRRQSCIPTRTATLCLPSDVFLLPDVSEDKAFRDWLETFGDMINVNIADSRIRGRERRSRAEMVGCRTITASEWLNSVLSKPSPRASVAAIMLLAALLSAKGVSDASKKHLRGIACVLTQTNQLAVPNDETVCFCDSPLRALLSDLEFVHEEVAANEAVKDILKRFFRIAVFNAEVAFRAIVGSVENKTDDSVEFWESVWRQSRDLNPVLAARVISSSGASQLMKVRTLDGHFRPLYHTLLPGSLVTGVEQGCQPLVVDMTFHSADTDLLTRLGATDRPSVISGFQHQLYDQYQSHIEDTFRGECAKRCGQTPHREFLTFENANLIGPIEPLVKFSGNLAVEMTSCFLSHIHSQPKWRMSHSTRPDQYPVVAYPSGVIGIVKRWGWVNTSVGPQRVKDVVGPDLRHWGKFLPVASCSDHDAEVLGLNDESACLESRHFDAAFERAKLFTGSLKDLGAFYAFAANRGVPTPGHLHCHRNGEWVNAPTNTIIVSCEDIQFEAERLRTPNKTGR